MNVGKTLQANHYSYIYCFCDLFSFRLVERNHPKYTFKCLFYCTWSICICRFQIQYRLFPQIEHLVSCSEPEITISLLLHQPCVNIIFRNLLIQHNCLNLILKQMICMLYLMLLVISVCLCLFLFLSCLDMSGTSRGSASEHAISVCDFSTRFISLQTKIRNQIEK